jgi:CheY-like chemotaxis protein
MFPSVVLCDDAPGFRLMLASLLEEAGLSVSVCSTWDEAVECAETMQPRAIVLDLWMPTFEATLLRRVHSVSPRSVIVVVSSMSVEESTRSVVGLDGIGAVVSKRDPPKSIVAAVKEAVA